MRVCACVSTYNRPHLLPYILHAFEHQTYEDRRLLIYCDHGQYDCQEGDRWRLVSKDDPARTLGEKRLRTVEIADQWCQPDVFAVWDDDDYYLPWALATAQHAAVEGAWIRPQYVWHVRNGVLRCHCTFGLSDMSDAAYQPGWAFRRDVFEQGLLWAAQTYTEDRVLALRLLAAGVPECKPSVSPYLVYDPYDSADRLSRVGGAIGWHIRKAERREHIARLVAEKPDIPPVPRTLTILPRPWGPNGDWLERHKQ